MNTLKGVIRWRPDWMADALCREYHAVDFFPGGGESSAPALAVCNSCPVISECLAHALEHRIGDGVWGGTTEAERERMLRREAALRHSARVSGIDNTSSL